MRYAEIPNLREVLPGMRSRAQELDLSGAWPENDLRVLANLGAMRWAVAIELGGEELSALELHFRYEAIASASLATALVLSQRDSAVDFIDTGDNAKLRSELLPRLANDEYFTTIGIAQLTTSRQGGKPALLATEDGDRLILDGVIPWSTGAAKSKYVIAGAALADGRQVLFALPMDLPGVRVTPPMPLVALRASWTAEVRCEHVELPGELILRGPGERALGPRKKSLPLGQAFLAMGLCQGALDLIAEHDSPRARQMRENFEQQLGKIREQVLEWCTPSRVADAAAQGPRIRGLCNELAVRITESTVALYKGTALLASHPAQRLAREAMFLLVWSCPDPVIDCTIELFGGNGPSGDAIP